MHTFLAYIPKALVSQLMALETKLYRKLDPFFSSSLDHVHISFFFLRVATFVPDFLGKWCFIWLNFKSYQQYFFPVGVC